VIAVSKQERVIPMSAKTLNAIFISVMSPFVLYMLCRGPHWQTVGLVAIAIACAYCGLLVALTVTGQSAMSFFRTATLEQAQRAIRAGLNVNRRLHLGVTPLAMSTANPDSRVFRAMLDAGGDVNAKDCRGGTVLMAAAEQSRHADVIMLIASRDVDVNAVRSDSRTALMLAAEFNPSPAITEALIAAKADVNWRSREGKTALMQASCFAKTPTVVEVLIRAGAKVDDVDNSGHTALMSAASLGRADFVRSLVRNGANVSIVDDAGKTAVAWAANDETRHILRDAPTKP
jgi:ankyrin repeat protein